MAPDGHRHPAPACGDARSARPSPEELSDSAQGVYAAALRGYIDTLHRLDLLPTGSRLPDLFSRSCIERVLVDWSQAHLTKQPGALAPRSQFRYAAALRLTLLRNGLSEAAGVIHELCTIVPVLKEGYHANKIMAEETVAWCSALLAEADKTRIFEMQHVLYRQRAEEALRAAEVAGFDLVTLAHPEKMKKLSEKKRSLASKILREARMFGSCAAFAAVELEGAPFRKANTLGLMMSGGGRQTFFDHAKGAQPHFMIVIPNELLKNGKSLTKRGQTMPPVIIAPPGPGSYATDILRFFLRRIRPLFPGAPHSHALFAPLDPKHSHLQDGTFDDWLLQCSKAIGLPLAPHNFRHGICSIQINDDPNCVDDLAILLADKPETIRRYYAFILREERLRQMQADRAARRAAYGVPRNAVGVA